MDIHTAERTNPSFVDDDFSNLETELKDYVIEREVCMCLPVYIKAERLFQKPLARLLSVYMIY